MFYKLRNNNAKIAIPPISVQYIKHENQKCLQWQSLQHRRAVVDLCMFHKLRINLANIAIPPISVQYIKHNYHHNHIQSLHSDAIKVQFFCQRCQIF